jgi:hypothetical protein
MSVVISVSNWARFQHYKDRDPPWVKLYRDLLTSESWVLGTDLSRVVQVASTLLAARYENKIPYRWDLLKRVMSLDCSEAAFRKAVDYLVESNFLEIQEVTEETKVVAQSASNALAKCSSETEERREETEKRQNGHSSAVPTDVTAVFDHWKTEHNHPKAQLDDKRLKAIRVALKSYSADQLCQSISGYKNSAHHMGQNQTKTVYDSIELFLRDAEHIDRGLKLVTQPAKQDWRNDPRYRGAQ